MAAVTAIVAGVGAAVSIGGGLIAGNQAKQAAKGYRNEAERKAGEIAAIEANRQSIPNPYANVKDLSGIAKDLSGMISNPFANLGVATQAAKMQAEEADISLANTLDTIRSTGAGSGGATALAQAALQSKKGVSSSIEQQESNNEKLKAEGTAKMQEQKMAEAQRLQGVQFSEAQRVQAAETEGIKFKYGEQESRDIAKLNRLSGQEAQQRANQAGAKQAQGAAIGGAISAVGSIVGGLSDRRLKKNIKKIGISPSGINMYSFEYKDSKFGSGTWQGVMSDEVSDDAVIRNENGYDMVNYSLLDVEFKQL